MPELASAAYESDEKQSAPTDRVALDRTQKFGRQTRQPARSIGKWLFTMLLLGLIGLLAGVVLGAMISG